MTEKSERAELLADGNPGFLVLEERGRKMAVPVERVLSVLDWETPFHLPLSSPGIIGWLPYEGCAAPLLDLWATGLPPEGFSLLLLIEGDGPRFFVPGTSVRFARGMAGPLADDQCPFASARLSTSQGDAAPADGIAIIDAVLLYRFFRLGYNSALDG